MTNNPYNSNQEAEFAHWEAGFAAQDELECPYEKDDSEWKSLRNIWMKGYKSRDKVEKVAKVEVNLESVATDLLEKVLIERKSKELGQLRDRRFKLQGTMNDLNDKIVRLEILCGE